MMTLVEAIALIKNTPASKVTAAELEALRQIAEKNPAIVSIVGGRQALEQYLAAAEQAISSTAAGAASAAPGLEGNPHSTGLVADDTALSEPAEPGQRRSRTLVLAIVLLVGVAMGLYLWRTRENAKPLADSRPTQKTPAAPHPPAAKPAEVHPAPQPPPSPEQPQNAKGDGQPSWQGWVLKRAEGARFAERFQWDLSDPSNPRPQTLLEVTGGGAELSAVEDVDQRHWLRISLAEGSQGHGGQIEVRADDQPVARFAVGKAGIYVVPLDFLQGKRVRLSVAHLPGKTPETIVWDSIRLVADKSGVAWKILKPQRVEASGGARLQIRPDHCVVVDGPNAVAEQYTVTATIPNINVRAIRLEALRDTSLPAGGPGRGPRGEFCVSQFGASLTDADERHDRLVGRYIRVELLTTGNALAMSELEVFSDGKNVALGKATVQSSVDRRAFGELAVDGGTLGVYNPYQMTTVMRTRAGIPDGWWEVDLGREYPIERIVIWSPGPALAKDLANHRLLVLDMHRSVVWQDLDPHYPSPSLPYGPFVTSRGPLEFQTAIVRTLAAMSEAPWLVRPTTISQGTGPRLGEACNFIFPLGRNGDDQGRINIAKRQVTFRIQHQDASPAETPAKNGSPEGHDNLGRFRISVTDDPVPVTPEPPTEVVALLPDAASVRGMEKPPLQPAPNLQTPDAVRQTASHGGAPTPAPPSQPPRAAETKAQPRRPNELSKDFSWEGWIVAAEPGAFATPKYKWDPTHTEAPRIEPRFNMQGRPVTLSQTRTIDATGAWLRLRAGQTTVTQPLGRIEVRADGRPIARFETLAIEEAPDRLVSLADFVGRKVKLDLVYTPGSDSEQVDWQIPTFVANPKAAGYAEWQALEPISLGTRWSAALTTLPDRSILAGGDNPPGEVYLVTVRMPSVKSPQEKITAVRLEVLPHTSLPMNGPGRGQRGSFDLGKFSAELVDPHRKPQTHVGRYVRVELPGTKRTLQMAELQVFAGGKNVALNKPAKQPSVSFNGWAERGVDGQIGPSYDGKGGVAFAHTADGPETWWEVDLQQDFPIERIVIWNRQASGAELADHQIVILDKDRKPVWQQTNPDIPIPCAAYEFPYEPRPVRFSAVAVSFDDRMRAGGVAVPAPMTLVEPPRDQSVYAWRVGDVPGQMQVATFNFAPDQNLAGQLVRFELGDFTPLESALGRFRLSVTTATEPQKAQRPVVIAERLPDERKN